MLTLTAHILSTQPVTLSIDGASREASQLAHTAAGTPPGHGAPFVPAAALDRLGDKALNTLMTCIRKNVVAQSWHVADPLAFDTLAAAYKTKDKVDVRRQLLASWFAAETTESASIVATVEAMKRVEDERIAAEKAAKKAAKKSKSTPTAIVTDHAGPAPGPVDEYLGGILSGVETSAPVVMITSDAATTTETAAKKTRAPKAPKADAPKVETAPKAPRDRYESMNLQQLLAAVVAMFGHTTAMTNESALRYKLRRGEKQLAAGQRPQFSVSTPASPRVRLTHERAAQTIEMLKIVEALGHGIAGIIISEIEEQMKSPEKAAA